MHSASITRRTAAFTVYCVAVALIHVQALQALYDYSMQNVTASHVMLVPFVSLALVYQSRRAIFASVTTEWTAGLPVLLLGLGLFAAARLYGPSVSPATGLALAVGALVVLWVGGFALVYGPQALRAASFPLLFLGFTVPIPDALLDGLILVLQTGSADAVGGLFALTGTPYFREGFIFALPTVAIEIAEECSGIRSSIALVLTSLLAGQMWLDAGWKKAALLAITLPLTILKNGIRIVTLTLLAIHVDPDFLTGQLHHDGGIVFFLLTLAMLAPFLALLRRLGPRRPATA